MFSLTNIIRKNILTLAPYSSARSEYKNTEGCFLDANENPYGNLNRYPDPLQLALKDKLASLHAVSANQIFIGNGSDEVIDLAFRIFCEPGKDKAATFIPTYGMYEVCAAINNVELIKIPLNEHFQLDETTTLQTITNDKNIKLIFICSPNNPTGNRIMNIEKIIENFDGIVIVDEAYIDFSKSASFITQLHKYPNLIVMQTFSKAWGLANTRVGIAYASNEIIQVFNNVKPPYNVSGLNQQAALNALNNHDAVQEQKIALVNERERMAKELLTIPCIEKVYPSDANFILVKVTHADDVYEQLIRQKIIIRHRGKDVANCLRLTIGTPDENNLLLNALLKLT